MKTYNTNKKKKQHKKIKPFLLYHFNTLSFYPSKVKTLEKL